MCTKIKNWIFDGYNILFPRTTMIILVKQYLSTFYYWKGLNRKLLIRFLTYADSCGQSFDTCAPNRVWMKGLIYKQTHWQPYINHNRGLGGLKRSHSVLTHEEREITWHICYSPLYFEFYIIYTGRVSLGFDLRLRFVEVSGSLSRRFFLC